MVTVDSGRKTGPPFPITPGVIEEVFSTLDYSNKLDDPRKDVKRFDEYLNPPPIVVRSKSFYFYFFLLSKMLLASTTKAS